MSAPDTAPLQSPPAEALQFQRAEYAGAGPDCAYCKKSAGPSYYHVGRSVACPACAERLRQLQTRPDRSLMLRATLYGLGAAIAGSVIFALISLTGFQFSIVAILVGIMVGKAIVRATQRTHQPRLPGAGRRADLRRDHHKLPAHDDLFRRQASKSQPGKPRPGQHLFPNADRSIQRLRWPAWLRRRRSSSASRWPCPSWCWHIVRSRASSTWS